MSATTAVILGIGILLALAIVRGLSSRKWPSDRQLAGLFLSGLILMLIGRASAPFAKGLTLLMVLAVVLTEGIPGLSVLGTKSTAPATASAPAK